MHSLGLETCYFNWKMRCCHINLLLNVFLVLASYVVLSTMDTRAKGSISGLYLWLVPHFAPKGVCLSVLKKRKEAFYVSKHFFPVTTL